MKKVSIIILLLWGFMQYGICQKVDSIKTEQAGDLIKIHYKILNSNSNQVFRVKVLCSINNGLQSVPKSLSGDFGDNVVGGRTDYMILWDVLKDVDELKSAEFFVTAEIIKNNTVSGRADLKPLSSRKFNAFLVYGGGNSGHLFGAMIGYIGSWGVTSKLLMGGGFSSSLDLTKRIVNGKTFNMHLTTGLNVTRLLVKSENVAVSGTYNSNCVGFDFGLVMSIRRFSFSACGSAIPEKWQKEGLIVANSSDNIFGYLGIGYRF